MSMCFLFLRHRRTWRLITVKLMIQMNVKRSGKMIRKREKLVELGAMVKISSSHSRPPP